MTEQHTPGRLFVTESEEHWGRVNCHLTAEVDQASICSIWVNGTEQNRADARRLAACWNALVDLPQFALDGGWTRAGLEAYGLQMEQQARQMQAQRDELLEALEGLLADYEGSIEPGESALIDKARAAITKATGEAA